MAKKRTSTQKRQREYQKRQRELDKAEKAAEKRKRRQNSEESDSPQPTDDGAVSLALDVAAPGSSD